jgi:hypothetical protein
MQPVATTSAIFGDYASINIVILKSSGELDVWHQRLKGIHKNTPKQKTERPDE